MSGVRLHRALIVVAVLVLSTAAPLAQQPPTAPTVLAVTSLPSVADAPLFFKLSKVELASDQTTTYFGPVDFLYILSGSLAVQTEAGQRLLKPDDALLTTAARTFSLSVSGPDPVLFLHFVLARATEIDQAAERPPAVVTQLYRAPSSIPGLKPGRYEFTLTRVSYPHRALQRRRQN
jgi:hypothetical protein